MRLSGEAAPGNMSSSGSGSFLLLPIPEHPLLDCVPSRTVKIAVLGASSVGKTALIVRFLTKRFIGDYEANTGALYSRKVTMDGEEVSLQIQDTPCVALQDDAEGLYCQEQINRSIYWADGYVLVFSITDNSSYRTIQPLYQHIRRIHPSGNIPVILVGNKSDLLGARQVPAGEGDTLAASLGGVYFEASARENHEGVHAAFLHLCQEVGPYLSVRLSEMLRLVRTQESVFPGAVAPVTALCLASRVVVVLISTILLRNFVLPWSSDG